MKKINMYFWIVTGVFSAFMIFTAIPNIIMDTASVDLITGLGYPEYFIPFIGIAKLAGSVLILIPGFHRLKEWAYSGLFFDLLGATYSAIAVEGFQMPMLFMVLPISFLFISYFLMHKRIQLAAS